MHAAANATGNCVAIAFWGANLPNYILLSIAESCNILAILLNTASILNNSDGSVASIDLLTDNLSIRHIMRVLNYF